jgi:hypothetical protein
MPHTTPASPLLPAAAGTPEVTVRRYAAPFVHITPVAEVISPAPAAGRHWPGHYQQVLLNTRTGELRLHESAEHLEPLDLASTAASDVPRETWKRWHPGTLFTGTGPHQWFEPVPELLCWVIDSGVTEFPYLDAAGANHFLAAVLPEAQALLDGLCDVAGELDWSAAAARSGRTIGRICSRNPLSGHHLTDADLADYQEIIWHFPQVYRPDLLTLPPGKLADACETITRFLGNEHWHPEIRKVFGTPSPDGTCVHLDVLGVRAWYQAAARTAGSGYQPDQVLHTVGRIQYWLDRAGLKTPRALCGTSLAADPGTAGPGPDAPDCPACQAASTR